MKKVFLFFMVLSAVMLYSCKEDVITVKNGELVQLNHGDTHQIEAESVSMIRYESSDEYCAQVSQYGLVQANYVGSANILLNNEIEEKIVKVEVKAVSSLYEEPDIAFGDTKLSVIDKLGTPSEDNGNTFIYKDYSSSVSYLLVLFENDRVLSYAVMLDHSYSSELATFIGERYRSLGVIDKYFCYINSLQVADATMMVGLGTYSYNQEVYDVAVYMSGEEVGELE
ncbi:MAG: Ig-like domain-containing protein [Bacteroidales bacterium]|nr:Ig-like domain-containing protein [Bacteroidales bacterium]MBR5780987.1 Ig-like domain-containing protein [Bacteroidales bacterium]